MIDIHMHHFHENRNRIDQVISHQDNTGTQITCLLPLEGYDHFQISTDEVLVIAKEYPDRFIPFCSVDPRVPKAAARLESFVMKGCRGCGEQKTPGPIDLPGAMEIYGLCGKLGIPILLHLQENRYNVGFDKLESLLIKFPETIFIGHAPTFWNNIGVNTEGSPPRGKVIPQGVTDRLLADYPNLFADLSAGSGLNAITRDAEFAYSFIRRHRTKLLWGTDCPCLDGKGTGFEECYAQCSITALHELCGDDQRLFHQITHANAADLLRLPEKSMAI